MDWNSVSLPEDQKDFNEPMQSIPAMNMDWNSVSLPEDQKDFNEPMQSIPAIICQPFNSNVQSSQEHTQVSEENCTNDNITADAESKYNQLRLHVV
ncbi:hypothetical protein QE152_g33672 [Popillia japonica]|uniref:Uncharacterized protein n=1 Tax=Popillia japonica TaxID=7064 RepID=A0AAW1IVZ0_POPJA